MTAVSKATNGGPPRENIAKGLGVFSFALGIPQILAPGRVNRMIGVRDDATTRMWMRAVGAREIAAGVGIFSQRRPAEWLWARVAGDTMDLALLGTALRGKSRRPGRTLAATGAVASAFAADLVDSVKLSRGKAPSAAQERAAQGIHVRAATTVRRDRGELYAFWRDLERFPQFMAHLEEVKATGPDRSRWKAGGPLGMSVEWDAEITEDVPGERISWRATEGAKVENSGTVRFMPAPGEQGTEVHVELRYDVPGGTVGSLVAKLFGEEPAMQIKDDLRRFKQIVETGEIARSDGSPEGQLSKRQLRPRPASPLPGDELAAATTPGGAA
ncbi:MAG: SRPBCC family protein [Thermoleophilia bacterium]